MSFGPIVFLMLFLVSPGTWAQDWAHQLAGKFYLESSSKQPVKFSLRWTEENGKITGEYADNYFARSAEVEGESGSFGRHFRVRLRNDEKGVRTISLLFSSARPGKTGATLPLSVVTRDKVGNPLTTIEVSAVYTAISTPQKVVVQKEEEKPSECSSNFGELEGYCGIYSGIIFEDLDITNSCNLLLAEDVALGLDNERNLRLYLAPTNTVTNPPTHLLGRLPPFPKRSIEYTVRNCQRLPGIEFSEEARGCKRLNLTGTFSIVNGDRHFSGLYTIFDEKTGRFCRYGLSLDRD